MDKLKNKVIFIIFFICMSFSTLAIGNIAYGNTTINQPNVNTENTNASLKPRNEGKNVLKRFFITMLWVGGSCVAIFLILLAYKKLNSTKLGQTRQIDISKNLNSPDTTDEAIKFFIEKF